MATPNPRSWHRVEADRFADLIDGTTDWDAPSPVAEWNAIDVVAHILVYWPGFFAWGGVSLPAPEPNQLAASFWAQAVAIDELCADEEALAAEFVGPDGFTGTLGGAISFYCADLFMHAWDLAKATGQDAGLDAATAEQLLVGMAPITEQLRALGQYGPVVEVPADAGVVDQFIGFIGRDPNWTPGAAPAPGAAAEPTEG